MQDIQFLIDAIRTMDCVEVQSDISIPVGDEASRRKAYMAHAIIDGAEYVINITPTDLGE